MARIVEHCEHGDRRGVRHGRPTSSSRACGRLSGTLQDLDETVAIVEANPKKFNLAPGEVASRKKFISDTRKFLGEVKQALLSTKAQAKIDTDKRDNLIKQGAKPKAYNKFAKLEDALSKDNQNFLDDQQQQQELIMRDQDQDLTGLSRTVGTLREIGNDDGRRNGGAGQNARRIQQRGGHDVGQNATRHLVRRQAAQRHRRQATVADHWRARRRAHYFDCRRV
jgi:hypothetical protein